MNALLALLCCLPAADVKSADDLSGFYWCFKEDGTAEPAGVVTIAHHEGRYVVTWTYSPTIDDEGRAGADVCLGVGRRHGRALAIQLGKAVYAYEIHPGAKGHVEITGEGERWQKIKSPCCVSAPLPEPHPAPPCRCEDCKCRKAGHDCRCGKADQCDCVLQEIEHADGTKEAVPMPPLKPESGPYDHLPSEAFCQSQFDASEAWRKGVEDEAIKLGYLVLNENPDLWDGQRFIWIGGGWHARAMQEEVGDCIERAAAWYRAYLLRSVWKREKKEGDDLWLQEIESKLRAQIGDAAYVRGQLPSPFPTWRIGRN